LASADPALDPVLPFGLPRAVLIALTLSEMRPAAWGRHRGTVPTEPPRISETN
jgi:hypothetical protein